jgi:nudix-type nucleoside diphosphatase (YffH/AdpP family)
LNTPSTPRVRNLRRETLNAGWSRLERITYDYQLPTGQWQEQVREAYDRGDGATVLLYDPAKGTVILTRQFRLPTFLNGNTDGHLIESCAGKLERGEDPADCVIREIEEETGFRVPEVKKVFSAYMSPGSVTELIHFYLARVDESMRVSAGGGEAQEQENIEVVELPLEEALGQVKRGLIKDGKTIMLLQHAALQKLI